MEDIFDILLPLLIAIGGLGLQLLKKKNQKSPSVTKNSSFFDEFFDEQVENDFAPPMQTETSFSDQNVNITDGETSVQDYMREKFAEKEESKETDQSYVSQEQNVNTEQKKRHRFNLRQAVIQTEILNPKYLK